MPVLAPPPSVDQDINSRQYRDWFYSIYALIGTPGSTLGTMAYQNYNSVGITGGQIANVGLTSVRTNGLSGYLYGNGSASPITASATIPWTDITGVPAFVTPKYGSFHYDYQTTLSTAIPNGTSTAAIVVASTTGFASSGYILIEKEIIGYTGTTATTFTGITRSLFSTSGAGHAIGSAVSSVQGTTANTNTAILFNATDYSNGISLGSPTSRIVFANAGMYNLQFSIQATNADTTTDDITIWFRKNGTDVSSSAGVISVPGKHGSIAGAVISSWNLFLQISATDYVEMYWSTDSGNSVLQTFPAGTSPVHPVSPAIIFTANQIA
jgi:hypothetical protein